MERPETLAPLTGETTLPGASTRPGGVTPGDPGRAAGIRQIEWGFNEAGRWNARRPEPVAVKV